MYVLYPTLAPRSQLIPEKGRCVLPQLFGERPLLPLLQADAPRVPEVILEDLDLAARESGVVDIQVGFVVQPE